MLLRIITLPCLAASLLLVAPPGAAQTSDAAEEENREALSAPSLLPQPSEIRMGDGWLQMPAGILIGFETRQVAREEECSLEAQAQVLAAELELLFGRPAEIVEDSIASEGLSRDPDIRLGFARLSGDLAPNEEDEFHGYSLKVDKHGVELRGAYTKGVSHGTATLLQLLQGSSEGTAAPFLEIRDEPQAAYRSVMLDVARKPHSLAVIRDVVRLARLYKLRYVHLHLTDDQHFTFPFDPITSKLANNHSWSRQELQDLVAYADARGVTLIPEIDLPGHSSRLRESGYLDGAQNDRDVAAAQHWPAIHALLDEVMEVFASSPFLHIGGDESGAGDRLLPFLGSMQAHVRERGRRLIVWEGFHGAPTEILPPTGKDRVIVASWESSYNAPWDLLRAGYSLINASWKPLYVVGGGGLIHPGSTGGRSWSPLQMADWDKDQFQHWEPGRPVYEDRGPGDDQLGDGRWSVPTADRERILGAQISVWEQRESSVVRDLRFRVPVLAERLWSGRSSAPEDLVARARSVDSRVFGLVQPIAIEVLGAEREDPGPIGTFYTPLPGAHGAASKLSLRSRLPLAGELRFSLVPFRGSFTWIDFPEPGDPALEGTVYSEPVELPAGGAALRAKLVRPDGTSLDAGTWARFATWPSRVQVTDYPLGRRTPETVPDLLALDPKSALRSYELPFIRGPIGSSGIVGQLFEAKLQVEEDGEYELGVKTQSGRASLYLDLDSDGTWSAGELLVANTPTSEAPQSCSVSLVGGQPYALRIDHASGLPRPVLIVTLKAPGQDKGEEISPYLLIR